MRILRDFPSVLSHSKDFSFRMYLHVQKSMYRRRCKDFRGLSSLFVTNIPIRSDKFQDKSETRSSDLYFFFSSVCVRRWHVFCWEVSSYECQSLRKCLELCFFINPVCCTMKQCAVYQFIVFTFQDPNADFERVNQRSAVAQKPETH